MKSLHICIGLRISVNPEMPYPSGGLNPQRGLRFYALTTLPQVLSSEMVARRNRQRAFYYRKSFAFFRIFLNQSFFVSII